MLSSAPSGKLDVNQRFESALGRGPVEDSILGGQRSSVSSRTAAERFIHLIYSSRLTGAASGFAGRGGEAMITGGL